MRKLLGVSGIAFAVLLTAAPATAQQIYFGNLHAHTAYSDGSGTPAEAYAAAARAGLDFMAVTEHNHKAAEGTGDRRDHLLIANQPSLYSGSDSSSLISAARAATVEGRFVAIYGQEFSTISSGNHVNVFDVPAVIDAQDGAYDDLLGWLGRHLATGGQPGLVQFNHPEDEEGQPNDYGRDDFGDDDRWLAAMDPYVELIEVLNAPALKDGVDFRSRRHERKYFEYLNLGFHLAPSVGHDNHYRNWGRSTDARVAVIADRLTKPAILSALRARHAYATEDKNLRIIFRANGALSGDITTPPALGSELALTVEISDPDEPDASYLVDVFVDEPGGEPMKKAFEVFRLQGDTRGAARLEGVSFSAPGQYVLLRVRQRNEHGEQDRAWTAPVWFEYPQAEDAPLVSRDGAAAVISGPRIVALLPNPAGAETHNESATLRNDSRVAVDLTGWRLRDLAEKEWRLSGLLGPGGEFVVKRAGQPMAMNN
ncbi:MAG TPA: CehA/McbA family metallohydrolase, partial [Caulobacteraceae bacterium]|nr:CehA/McbA family metallohydrolase [Caulobacteraceae bacterium]